MSFPVYQFIEDISLMNMNCNQGLELCSVHFAQFLSGLLDQEIEQVQETLISLCHDLTVVSGGFYSIARISCPDYLNTE